MLAWTRLLLAAALVTVVACGGQPASVQQATQPAARRERIFYLGRIPFLTATEVVKGSEPLLEELAAKLGYDRVVMVLAPSYEGVLDLLVDRKVDAAWFGTEAYRDARSRGHPVEALAVPRRKGRTWYEGVVICRADSGFLSLADLKGKRFGFVDPRSSSGWAAPRRLLVAAGLEVPDSFSTREPGKADFLMKHDNVVHAVYFGKMDAGAVYDRAVEDTFEDEPSKRAELTVLARTGKIPNEPIVVRSDTDPGLKKRILSAFLQLDLSDAEQRVFGGVERFLPFGGEDTPGTGAGASTTAP